MACVEPTRPALRWHGGKWRLAPWIIGHFPPHRTYVEPFGGAASVLLRKERAYAEVYNDLDAEVVNLFRVLRSDQAGDLIRALDLTPFARAEFEAAYGRTDDPVERARRLVIRSFMGFGTTAGTYEATGFRANSNRSGTTPARDWDNLPRALLLISERIKGVVIEDRPAVQVMQSHDGAGVLHYVDPPYVHETRGGDGHLTHKYAIELTDDDHAELLDTLQSIKGSVVLSGYASALYDDALSDWHRVEREALADGARKRVEVLWMNFDPAAAGQLGPLFAEGAG